MVGKYLCIVIFSVFLFGNLGTCDEIVCDFQAYLTKFNKVYSEEQKQKRKEIFEENCAQLQKTEEQAQGAYHVACNKFTDMTKQETIGLFKSPLSQEELKVASEPKKLNAFIHEGSELLQPAPSIDYRNYNGRNYVTPPKDQGSCGSCWSFTTASFFESYYLLKGYQGNSDFSEQYILQCSGAGTCRDGGYTHLAIRFGRAAGVALQSSMKYEAAAQGLTVEQCQSHNRIPFSSFITDENNYPYYKKQFRVTDQQLKSILTNYGPVSVAIEATTSFLQYSSGVYNGCPSTSVINHGALLIGYTEDGDWIVKNSWGTSWGQGGFGIISKDYNCGMDIYADYLIFNNGSVFYKLVLQDKGNDGLEGYVFGIRNIDTNQILQFGRNFTTGSSQIIDNIEIRLNNSYEFIVVQAGDVQSKGQIRIALYDQSDVQIFLSTFQTDFKDQLFTFCPDCYDVQFIPTIADDNGESDQERFKLLMFVFIGVSGVMLAAVISLILVICRYKKHTKKLTEKCYEFRDKAQTATQNQSKKAYGFDTQAPKNAVVQAPNKKLQAPNKRKAPLPPPPATKSKSPKKPMQPSIKPSQSSAGNLNSRRI